MDVCNFCLKPADRSNRLVMGPGVAICQECIGSASALVGDMAPEPELRSFSERLGGFTVEELALSLPDVAKGVETAQKRLAEWVAEMRRRGVSWATIAEHLGVTRQSAWERFSGKIKG